MSVKVHLNSLGFALLFLGSVSLSIQYNPHRLRNKNWCAFIVQKNVSCAVRADIPTMVEAEAAPCPAHQPDCEPSMIFQTHFQPSYRISYKTVTELEWRCCPGYQGPDCRELKGSPNRQMLLKPQPKPYPLSNTGYMRNSQRPSIPETERYDSHHEVEKTRQLEEEVQRLSQTVLDLQAAMTSMTANLRTDLQEDTSKMLITLLGNMHVQDSAKTGSLEESLVHLDGHQATRGLDDKGMEEVMARLNEVTDALKSKDEAIEELREAVTGHSGQIRMLMDASQGLTVTAGASSDIDILQSYIDTKFDKLKKELLVEMKDEIANLKSACNDSILSVQKTCKEGWKESNDNLSKQLRSQKDELRKEISEVRMDMVMSDGLVRTHRQTAPFKGHDGDLQNMLQRLVDAQQILNARVDNELVHLSMLQLEDLFGPRIDELEARMNVTERNAETYCFYVDEKLTTALAEETAKIRALLDKRLNYVEDQFTAMLIVMTNTSFPDMLNESANALQTQVNANKYAIQGLEDKLNTVEHICSTKCNSSPQRLGSLETIVEDVRHCRNQLAVLSTNVENSEAKLVKLGTEVGQLKLENQQNSHRVQNAQNQLAPLIDNMSGLTDTVTGLGDAVSRFNQDLQTLNSSCCLDAQVKQIQTPLVGPSLSHEASKPSLSQTKELSNRLDRLRSQVTAEFTLCKEKAAEDISAISSRVATLEESCARVNDERNQVQATNENLEKNLAQINSTLQTHARGISNLQITLHNVHTQLASIKNQTTKQQVPLKPEKPNTFHDSRNSYPLRRTYIPEIHIPVWIPQREVPVTSRPFVRQPHAKPSTPRQPYAPLQPSIPHQQPNQPVVLTGVAGPPGYAQRASSRRERGSHHSGKPIIGYAGVPGNPHVNPVAYKPHPVPVYQTLWNPAQRLVAKPALSERNMAVEPFSFSAGLTQQAFMGDFGIIHFNKVLVNDGGHYNPQTGIFTVPVNGRYLVSAVLTAPRHERIEAVLSVSERSVQKLDSAGYGGHNGQHTSRPCQCGSSVSFSLVLSLRAGDRVALVRTAGTLALSEAKEILSTFSCVFLYSTQVHR
ncbi:EMILIN-2 isoform X2 [Silurus meridionalis]|uniref:EMILIN-2 isoform X2 n=1 Tax=Silurus meridionalis TaxID=175797 RepID=UPI001EE9C56E|nr:EMILIN-2 isoform X2 [Silurus meridionalis]